MLLFVLTGYRATAAAAAKWMRLHETEMAKAPQQGPYPHVERVINHPEAEVDPDASFELAWLGSWMASKR